MSEEQLAESQTAAPETIGSDTTSMHEAAEGLASSRETSERVDEVGYQQRDPATGNAKRDADGRPVQTDPRVTVSREQGAKDLAAWREARAKAEETEAIDRIAASVDATRAGLPPRENPAQASPAQLDAQTQLNAAYLPNTGVPTDESVAATMRDPNFAASVQQSQQIARQRLQQLEQAFGERVAAGQDASDIEQQYNQVHREAESIDYAARMHQLISNGNSPRVAAALADREVLEFVRSGIEGFQTEVQNVMQQAQAEVGTYVSTITSLLFHQFPELRHIQGGPQNFAAALETIRLQNPARFEQISRARAAFHEAIDRKANIDSQAKAEQQRQFAVYGKEQDSLFQKSHAEFHSHAMQVATANGVVEYLRTKGVSQADVLNLHRTNPLFRNAAFQSCLYDAYRYSLAKNNAGSKRYSTPTRVFSPGSGAESNRNRGEKLPAAMNGASGLRQAAAILQSRRSR